MTKSVYEIITEKIIGKLEKGVVPWRQPWTISNAVNWKTQKPYRGINIFLVEPGEYASKKQILDAGGRIKKEELKNSHIIVYWLWKEKEDEETGEKKTFAKPFYYRVWEINKQCTGLESKRSNETFEHDPIEKAEEIFKGYINSPDYTFQSGKAVYYPTWDRINCPPKEETLLKIITWKNELFTSRVGRVTKIDRYAKKIKILDELDSEFTLNFFDIIDVKLK